MEPQEKILKTSLELFFKYGIKRVTMDDIAKELGMSKKTIYQFYKEKDDLVNQLCATETIKYVKRFDELLSESNDPIHEMIMMSNQIKEMMQQINPVFFLDLQKFYPQAFKEFQNFKDKCTMGYTIKNIKRGIEMGVYRKDINAGFTSRYRMAQVDMLMLGSYFSFDEISMSKTHELILDMFVYGICTVKGHKLINNYKKIKEEE